MFLSYNIGFWNKLPKDVQGGTLKASEIVENAFSIIVYNETVGGLPVAL